MIQSSEVVGIGGHLFSLFHGSRLIASGAIGTLALTYKAALAEGGDVAVLLFDNCTGRSVDVDIRGSDEEVVARAQAQFGPKELDGQVGEPSGRGRPKLGVVAREVTLLPRHWDWLGEQRGGASVTLRRLVDDARKANEGKVDPKKARERAYYFMSAMAGDLPNFEEASRALFAGDQDRLTELTGSWPEDLRSHTIWLMSA